MTEEKCGYQLQFMVAVIDGKFIKNIFECTLPKGHKGKHHTYGSIEVGGNVVETDYELKWTYPYIKSHVAAQINHKETSKGES